MTCSVSDCERPSRKRGWCGMHYTRWQRHGDTNVCLKPKLMMSERVSIGKPEECWDWIGACVPGGYGTVTINRKQHSPHRVVYEQTHGPIETNDLVVQTCGNKKCCNPGHLKLETHSSASYWAQRDRCMKGHAYTEENVYITPEGFRSCRICTRAFQRKFHNSPKGQAKRKQRYANGVRRTLINAKAKYWGDRCWVCEGDWNQIDHVKPIARGGVNLLSNMRPICASCNSKKRATWPFLKEMII